MNNPNQRDPRDADEPECLLAETTAGCALLLLGALALVLILIVLIIAYWR